MKYRVIEGKFDDGSTWYKVQYKHFNWIPWWTDYRYEEDRYGSTVIWELWFPTKEKAEDNFKKTSGYFRDRDPKLISSRVCS